jgi:hypothetical protein
MDGEYRAGARKGGVACIGRLEVGGDEAGHPVVEVEDVKGLAERLRQFDDGAAEVGEPFHVVIITVELAAMEILRRVYEVDGDRGGAVHINGAGLQAESELES